jgi:hypothetical protein
MINAGVGKVELEQNLHRVLKDAGHADHIFGPPIHGVGIEFEESPLPPGHAFFHGEKAPPPLPANVVISVGNCGLYTGAPGGCASKTPIWSSLTGTRRSPATRVFWKFVETANSGSLYQFEMNISIYGELWL